MSHLKSKTTWRFISVRLAMIAIAAAIALGTSGGVDAERSEFAPKDPSDGYTLAGPYGEPMRDRCGDIVRATKAEMFEAMDDLVEPPPVMTQADVYRERIEIDAFQTAADKAFETMGVDHDRETVFAILEDPNHERAQEFKTLFDKHLNTELRKAGVAPLEDLGPATQETFDAALENEPTEELFEHVVEKQNQERAC